MKYFAYFMVLIYVTMGFFFIFAPVVEKLAPGNNRLIFGALFLAYGIYRAYSTYKKYHSNYEITDEN